MIPSQVEHSTGGGAHCRLCAERAEQENTIGDAAQSVRHAFPYAVMTFLALFVAFVDRGFLGAIALGMVAGMFTGALYVAARRRGFERAVEGAHAAKIKAISDDADARVQAVVTQFEWAVNDVASLRARLEQSEEQVRTLSERTRVGEHQNEQLVRQISRLRERLAEIAMNASLAQAGEPRHAKRLEPIALGWTVERDGARARLALTASAADQPVTRVRVTDRDGEVVAVTTVGVFSVEGTVEFQLEPPPDLIADLDAARESSYHVEILVGDAWRRVLLNESGRRAKAAADVNAHLLSATSGEGQQVAASRRRSLN